MAKDNSSFKGSRFGSSTNDLTPEFRAFLASRRASRKKAERCVKEATDQLAKRALEGTNDVTLRDVNRMTRPPTSYIKKTQVEFQYEKDRRHDEYLRRQESAKRKAQRRERREHTTLLSKNARIEKNDVRIRQKKSSRNSKPVPVHFAGVKRQGASQSRVGDAPVESKVDKLPQPLPRVPERIPDLSEAVSLLQIEEWLGESGVSQEAQEARALNELEQMF